MPYALRLVPLLNLQSEIRNSANSSQAPTSSQEQEILHRLSVELGIPATLTEHQLYPMLLHPRFTYWLEKGTALNFAVEVKGLRKTFVSGWLRKREKVALKDVDLSVPQGALWGILGQNGAGKTTLLSILSNLLTPEQGEVRVLGKNIPAHAREICSRINLCSGHANFLWGLTVRENLDYYGMLYGLSGRRWQQKVEDLIELFDLAEFARVRFDELSTGTKQKLSLAKALINEPELLLLDEPTVGLDPDVSRRIREYIQLLHDEKGTTILLTTHNMKEAEILCQQVAFLKDGTIKACGRPQELKRELRLGDTILVYFQGSLPVSSVSLLQSIKGVYGLQTSNSSCTILVDDHKERLPQLLDVFVSNKIFINDIRIQESNLEDVFIAFAR